ncbi:MAG: ComEA family DNA-binding protein [Thermoleophilaceae bacterium]|nr:ComEA family DNA-binding protein [Thermoleophilaceae bacterium]
MLPSVVRMIEIPRPMLAVYAAAALVVALIGARYLQVNSAASAPPNSSAFVHVGSGSTGATGGGGGGFQRGPLVLHVTGAVRRPGLVEVDNGDRVGNAITRAGGPTHDADLTAVNLAMRVADGQQIIVPSRSAAGRANGLGASGTGAAVSLNTATAEQLDSLDGVGPGLAAKIIAARTQKGGFGTVDDLADVPGIGEKRLESLRAQLQP